MFRTVLFLVSAFLCAGLPGNAWAQEPPVTTTRERVTDSEFGIQSLDAILDRAGTIDEFLANKALIDQYFQQAHAYYGTRFGRAAFDHMIAGIRQLVSQIPELKVRAWSKDESLPDLVLEAEVPHRNVKLNFRKFQGLLERMGFSSDVSEQDRAQLPELLQHLTEMIQQTESQLAQISGNRQKRIARAKAYESLRASPQYRTALGAIRRLLKEHEYVNYALRSGNADVILAVFDEIKTSLPKFFPELEESAALALNFLANALPDSRVLLADTKSFPAENKRNGDIAFNKLVVKNVPRRFHALFRGIVFRECIGGSGEHTSSSHPARWALPLLAGQNRFIENADGKFRGYIVLPELVKGDKHYYDVDIVGDGLSSLITLRKGNGFRQVSFFERWLELEHARKPQKIDAFLYSYSSNFLNSWAYAAVWASSAWLFGEQAPHGEFKSADKALEARIVTTRPKRGHARTYVAKRMVHPATSKPHHIVVLQAPPEGSPWDQVSRFQTPGFISETFFKQGTEREARFWTAAPHLYMPSAQIGSEVKNEARIVLNAWNQPYNPLHALATDFLESDCTSFCVNGIFRFFRTEKIKDDSVARNLLHWALALPNRQEALRLALRDIIAFYKQQDAANLNANLARLIQLLPDEYRADAAVEIQSFLALTSNTASEFIQSLQPSFETSQVYYKKLSERSANYSAPFLNSYSPTASEIRKYRKLFDVLPQYFEHRVKFAQWQADVARNATQFLEAFVWEGDRSVKDRMFKEAVSRFGEFLEHEPSTDEIERFILEICADIKQSIAVIREWLRLRPPRSVSDYMAVIQPHVERPSAKYREQLAAMHISNIDTYAHLNPTEQEMLALLKVMRQSKAFLAFVIASLDSSMSQTAESALNRFVPQLDTTTARLVSAILAVRGNRSEFLRMGSPSVLRDWLNLVFDRKDLTVADIRSVIDTAKTLPTSFRPVLTEQLLRHAVTFWRLNPDHELLKQYFMLLDSPENHYRFQTTVMPFVQTSAQYINLITIAFSSRSGTESEAITERRIELASQLARATKNRFLGLNPTKNEVSYCEDLLF